MAQWFVIAPSDDTQTYAVTYEDSKTGDAVTVEVSAGQRFDTDDPCEFLSYGNGFRTKDGESLPFVEAQPGVIREAQLACGGQIAATIQAAQAEPIEVTVQGEPIDHDNGDQQGAPGVAATAQVASARSQHDVGDGGVPDAIFAQENPTLPDLAIDLVAPEASAEEAEALKTDWLHNDPDPGERHPTHSGEASRSPVAGADPVDLFSGRLTLRAVDLDVPSPLLPLRLVRSYRSGRPYFGPWGFGWDHNFNVYLRELADGGAAVWRGDLHEDYFRWTGDAFEPEQGVHERLERMPGQPQAYCLTRPGGLRMLFEIPASWTDAERIPLVEIRDRHGNGQLNRR